MQKNSTPAEPAPLLAGEAWFDPIEAELRERARSFLEEIVEQEATAPWDALVISEVGPQSTGMALAAAAGLVRIGRDRSSPSPAVGSRWMSGDIRK